MARPTLRQLRFLVALADSGSFSRAAEAAHVSQPTLSSGIKELESLLGVALAERGARGAILTHAGRAAATRARAILGDVEQLVATAKEAARPFAGRFHLGAIPTIAPFVLTPLLSALKPAHPDLKPYLKEDQTARLIDGLRQRTLDAAVIALPWEASGIETLSVADDEFLLVAPSTHPLAAVDRLTPHDLAGHELLLLEDGHCLRDHAIAACAAGTGRTAEVAATSLATLVNMAAGGLGVTLVPRLALDNGLAIAPSLSARRFTPPVFGRSIGVAWLAGSSREPEAQLVARALAQIGRGLHQSATTISASVQ